MFIKFICDYFFAISASLQQKNLIKQNIKASKQFIYSINEN